MERLALLALASIRVVLAVALHLPVLVQAALGGVPVALASPPYCQVGNTDVLAREVVLIQARLV